MEAPFAELDKVYKKIYGRNVLTGESGGTITRGLVRHHYFPHFEDDMIRVSKLHQAGNYNQSRRAAKAFAQHLADELRMNRGFYASKKPTQVFRISEAYGGPEAVSEEEFRVLKRSGRLVFSVTPKEKEQMRRLLLEFKQKLRVYGKREP